MKQFNKNKELKKLRIKQNKNTYIKKISIVISCFILLIGIIMFTFAKFESNSSEYTLINGKVKYLGGDINIVSYNYDGRNNSEPPSKEDGYILTNINCENAQGEWDDLNWELNISNLTSKVKCNLEFDKTSNYQIIKYNTNGGYLEEQYKKGVVGEQLGELPTPIKVGYTFDGWYKESTFTNKVEETTIIDQTITNLYAKYTVGGENINRLILADDIASAYYSGLTFYDSDFFDYVSGSQRTAYSGATNITLKAKFSGEVVVWFGKQSNGTLSINGVSQTLVSSKVVTLQINSGDTVNVNFPIYYNALLMFYNCDRSTWQGGNIGG